MKQTAEWMSVMKQPNQTQTESTPVYRICATSAHRWDVLRNSSSEPVATFTDKPTALAHAMSLARASRGAKTALRTPADTLCSIIGARTMGRAPV